MPVPVPVHDGAGCTQMPALPPSHPLAVASRLGNPAIDGEGKKKKKGARGTEAEAENAGEGKGGGSSVANRGGRGKQGEPAQAQAPHAAKKLTGSKPAGKDGVVPDDEGDEA